MKGLTIIRAKPSNAIDVYPLMEAAQKEGLFMDSPSVKDLKTYYFQSLLKELGNEYHFWFLARRGRGFLGYAHAVVIPRRWDGTPDSIIVDLVFVTESRRKLGIGAKLIDEVTKAAENMGIRKIEFICPTDQTDKWAKKRKAKTIGSAMRVEV